ncbi:hypothetical protein XV92_11375 [Vibrio metoecus]|uniref:Uncharacterized protein n=2 Tax=Vibrionaceae TaxID=641 RepID=A0A0Q0V0T3_VIBMT|nr:hypothetical protein [Vibrio metoecus]KQA25185.1 hypothetical protein AAY53_16135 [Vibrio metoecus]KQB00686.1 hypothetical protein XV92_11375 [Vibrio metoecus]KQB05672.1 hypothetical protein XV93_10805 [Vibrio metoecus]KQB10550.1 hypothetical protein XV94_05805 [Vibrio metoecus]
MALTKGQPMAVQICSRQICHSLAAYLQLQVVWVYKLSIYWLEPENADKKTPPKGGAKNLTDRSKINTGSICFVAGITAQNRW